MDVMSVLPWCAACGVIGNGIGYWVGQRRVGEAVDVAQRANDQACEMHEEAAVSKRTITDLRAALETAEGLSMKACAERDQFRDWHRADKVKWEQADADADADLTRIYELYHGTITALTAERDDALRRVEVEIAAIEPLEKERDDWASEANSRREQCVALIAERGRLFDTLADLRAALETAERQARGLQVQWNFARTVNEDLFEENTRLEALSASLTKERDQANATAQRCYIRIAADTRQFGNMAAEVSALTAERDALRDELARWKRPRDAKEHFVASEAVGPAMAPAMSERL